MAWTTDYDYEFITFRIPIVTDATVVDRTIVLSIKIDGSEVYGVPINAVITASTTAAIIYGNNLPYTDVGDVRMIPFSEGFRIPRGAVISTVSTNLQAGDNIGEAVALVSRQ